MKQLVIFDLDGTLINTIADLAASTNQALAKLGYPQHDVDAYKYFVGNGINKLFERALPEDARNDANIMKVRTLFLPYYNAHNADFSRPYKGIPELLESLQNQGIKIAVASNKYQQATTRLIRCYFPDILFCSILGQRDGVPAKPDPTVILDILQTAKVQPKDTLYAGDSNVDMITGKNAQVDTCGVTWGFRPRKELEKETPQFIVEEPREILTLI